MWNFNLIFILVESVFSLYVQQKSVFLRVCAFSSRNTLCRHSEAKKKKHTIGQVMICTESSLK